MQGENQSDIEIQYKLILNTYIFNGKDNCFLLQIANFATDLQYQQAHEQDFYGQRYELRGLRSTCRQGHTKSEWRERGERQPVDEPSTGGF